MRLDDIYTKPGHLIRRAQQIAVAIFMDACAEFDITPVQYAALAAIGSQPGIDATRISEFIAFDRSTLGSVLDRLVGKGLVARDPSPHDRRVKVLHLTPAGNTLLRAAEPAVRRAQERILAPLTEAEQWQFMRLLEQLVELNNERSRVPLKRVAGVPS